MARKLLKDTCPTAADIIAGNLDSDLDFIIQAAQARKKMMFRKGSRVTCIMSGAPAYIAGKTGTVLKVNSVRVGVGFGTPTTDMYGTTWSEGEYNIPSGWLTAVAA